MDGNSTDALNKLRRAAVEFGDLYVAAIADENDAKALALAELLLIELSELIPHEDEYNSAHTLLLNMLMAYQEIGAGRLTRHPILKGRHEVGGIGQLPAAQEYSNGIGAAVVTFLMEHGYSEDAAAKAVAKPFGVGVTAVKDWRFSLVDGSQRRLLKAMATPTLDRVRKAYEHSASSDPLQFADHWLREQLKAMFTLSPR